MIAPSHFRTWAFVLVAPALLVSHCAALEPEFDFIIVGGGTAGLTLANRLTEFPHVTVAVIEAGGEVINNPNVTDPNSFTVALGTAIDWQYESVNQTHAGDQKIAYNSGKALGGTSTINGMILASLMLIANTSRHDICARRESSDRCLGKTWK